MEMDFKLEFLANDTIDCYKEHLVAKAFNQREGIDYPEKLRSVIKMTTIRIILYIASSKSFLNMWLHIQEGGGGRGLNCGGLKNVGFDQKNFPNISFKIFSRKRLNTTSKNQIQQNMRKVKR